MADSRDQHQNIDFLEDSNSNWSINTDAPESTEDPQISGRISQALKKLTFNQNMKFMENFDPEQSNRERRKLTRKITTSVVGATVSAGTNRKYCIESIEIEGMGVILKNEFR
uniref:Uncharacterized protein n=2 Tax=Timema TaxID=61471 RepID=A0A7R9K7C6_TIMGE|nr:unnamed protein product [Timema genevievae]